MRVSELAKNPLNPRRISEKKKNLLSKSMQKWGDLGCIVFNETLNRLVAGHQRVGNLQDWDIVITDRYAEPNAQGTIAEGYLVSMAQSNERYKYRVVQWNKDDEIAAMLAANNQAGEYNRGQVSGLLLQLDEVNYDMEFTMLDDEEVKGFFDAHVVTLDDEEAPEDKSIVTKTCPSCGFELSNG